MPQDDKSYIEELKKSLYSRTAPDVRTRRKLRFNDSSPTVQTTWEKASESHEEPVLTERYENHTMSFFTKLLIGSFIFFVIAVGIGAYLFLNGANLISANNIDITINGPVSIPGGETVPFDIVVSNKNNVDLQGADLSVDFPEGTTDPANSTQELKTYHEFIGDIAGGQSAQKTVKAIIFGEENLQKTITVTVTYKVKGSSSVFTKNKSYDVLINSSPISLNVSTYKEISSNQEFDLKVDLVSNSQQTLKNVLLDAQYPFGFTYLSSTMPPSADNSAWKIGDIPPGGKKTITIHGKMQGEDSDVRTFRFAVGAQSANDPKIIGTEYVAVQQDITIQKPFISLNVSIDNDTGTGDHVGSFDHASHVQIEWTNNIPTPISNVQITAKLAGNAYDQASVQPDLGFFRSATNEVIWNQQTNKELGTVNGGDAGRVSFTVIPRDKSGQGTLTNPQLTLDVSVSGNRTQELNVPISLASAVERTIKISSNVMLSGRTVRTVGPFMNTGPVPPKVNTPTTYTIIWDVDNTTSSVGNAKVTATLPPYVKWLNAVSPASENMTYDKNTGTVVWTIGNLNSNTQSSSRRREVAFQVSITPSVNQVDQYPTLVNPATLAATDTFTGQPVSSTQDYLSTRFSTDPSYKDGDDKVVK